VTIRYAAQSAWANRKYVVTLGSQALTGVVAATGEGYRYKTFDLGYLEISKAGPYTVSIRPAANADRYLMYFQSLQLEPEGVLLDLN
jgi:hypothetical protein